MTDTPLMLSVSGARGIVGQSLTPPLAATFAAAFGGWVRDGLDEKRPPHVVVGRDSRPSGAMIERAAVSGLLAVGCRVTRLDIATTPGTAIMTDQFDADAGLIVTASHNPAQWNGLKPLVRGGSAPPKEDAERIIERFHALQNSAPDDADSPYVGVEALQPCVAREDTQRIHAERVIRCVDVDAIRKAELTVVVDTAHGAGGTETMSLLNALGVQYFHLHPEPTGRFPHPPEPTADNLADVARDAMRFKPDVVFAQDPDADRLAIIDEQGRYIGEEYTLALCALHRLQRGETAVANLSTSRMIDDVAQQAGATVVRTAVGEANVAAGMRQNDATLGGEGNGGIIVPGVTFVRDSLIGIALLLEMLAQRKQPLSEIVRDIPAYAIVKDKCPVDADVLGQMEQTLRAQYPDQHIDTQDGVRLDWPDRWVHVRPSNTEPIVRLIAEARDADTATSLLTDVRQALGIEATAS